MKSHLLVIFISFLLSSCISVQVPLGPKPKLENVQFEIPSTPFVELSTDTADAAWISERTGNTLSFLSECKSPFEKVEDVSMDAVKGIENAKVVENKNITIGGIPSHQITVQGFVETSKVKMSVATLKSEGCFVTLTYGGLEKNFSTEFSTFESFKKGFKAP